MRTTTRRRRGISIAVALMVILILVVVGLAIGTLGIHNLNAISLDKYQRQALYAAEAGAAAAMDRLKSNASWSDGLSATKLPNGDDTYAVTVTNNAAGSSAVTAADGASVPAGSVYVVSTGTGPRNVQKNIVVTLRKMSPFQFSVFGDKSVGFGGTTYTDAFDSSVGPYATSKISNSKDADIGTNGIQNGAISLTGNVNIDGDVVVGPGGDTSTAIVSTGQSSWTGTPQAAAQRHILPQAQPSPSLSGSESQGDVRSRSGTTTLTPGKYGSLTGTNGTVVLTSGTYYFTGNISLMGNANIKVDASAGPVIIYVDGSVDLTGGSTVNTTQDSRNLILYGTDSCTSVKLSGGSQAYMGVYARKADIAITGNSDLYGAVVGATITVQGNAPVHYDRALQESITVYSWGIASYERR